MSSRSQVLRKEDYTTGRFKSAQRRLKEPVCQLGRTLSREIAIVSSGEYGAVSSHRADTFSELLNNLQMNVAYGQQGASDSFVQWSSAGWLSTGPLGNQQQRLAGYPNQIPRGDGVPAGDYATSGNTLGYMYRRNFTFGLARPANSNDGGQWTPGTGPAQSWTLASSGQFPPGTDGGDVQAIACAVNTFGQADIYQADYNGLCFNGGQIRSARGQLRNLIMIVYTRLTFTFQHSGFATPESFSSCVIEFAQAGSTKRSLGQFHGWDVLSKCDWKSYHEK